MALRSGRVGIHPSQVDPITGMLLNGPAPGSISFEDLSDAQITDPEVGQTLIYNGTGWENEFSSISPTTLAALQDVALSSVSNDQILRYNSSANKWENEDMPSIPAAQVNSDWNAASGVAQILNKPTIPDELTELSDVDITSATDGDYLVYDGTNNKWINSASAPTPVTPEGSTVLPTDDIQTWLACAAITDKTYTTLNEVLADSTTLLALMSSNNAVDYLVRSTTWASGVCANSTAMTDIGANNYCANTLLDDATWCTAICNSTYFESVLNVKVPTMTSNTTPSGVASASSEQSSAYAAWKAFNSSEQYGWYCESSSKGYPVGSYIQYEFPSAVKIYMVKAMLKYEAVTYSIKMKFNGSNDGTTWSNDLLSDFTVSQTNPSSESTGIFTSAGNYTIYRAESTQQATSDRTLGFKMQFYGR